MAPASSGVHSSLGGRLVVMRTRYCPLERGGEVDACNRHRPERLLQRSSNGLGDDVCARARISRTHRDRRRRDIRIHRYRQRLEPGEPGNHDECRHDHREQGSVDEEIRDHGGLPGSLFLLVPSAIRTALTGTPGTTLSVPSTTTRTPGVRPAVTATSLPASAPSSTGAGATWPLPSTVQT